MLLSWSFMEKLWDLSLTLIQLLQSPPQSSQTKDGRATLMSPNKGEAAICCSTGNQ